MPVLPNDHPAESSIPVAYSVLTIEIVDLAATYSLRHQFHNAGSKALDAAYFFPIPLDAAFLDMTAVLAGKSFDAVVQEPSNEKGFVDAHDATFHMPRPGLLRVNLGILEPGEAAHIVLRFAAPLHVADGNARLWIPRAHRPRYARWIADSVETPDPDRGKHNPMSLALSVRGVLAMANADCPNCPGAFIHEAEGQSLHIENVPPDCDLDFRFEIDSSFATIVRCIADGDDTLALVSVMVPYAESQCMPLDLVLVLDCSTTMRGEAIEHVHTSLQALSRVLTSKDRIQIIRIGRQAQPLFRRSLKTTPQVCAALMEIASYLEADRGYGNAAEALELSLRHIPVPEPNRQRAIMLITKSKRPSSELTKARNALQQAAVPTFVVAIEDGTDIRALRSLAEQTRGALECATTFEPVDACVIRQLRRARGRPISMKAAWPNAPEFERIDMPPAFPGDVLELAARWSGAEAIAPRIEVSARHEPMQTTVPHRQSTPTLRVIVGLRRYATATVSHKPCGQKRRTDLALRYGLLTPETAVALVRERGSDESADRRSPARSMCDVLEGGWISTINPLHIRSGDYADDRDNFNWNERVTSGACYSSQLQASGSLSAISPERVAEIWLALLDVLRKNWLRERPSTIGLHVAVCNLPNTLRDDAILALKVLDCWEDCDGEAFVPTILRALSSVLSGLAMSEEEEARLTLIIEQTRPPNRIERFENSTRFGIPNLSAAAACRPLLSY